MNNIKTIFLDLDGVIRDFVRGVIEFFNLSIAYEDINRWNFFEEELNIPDFWEQLDFDFWVNLPKTEFADEILEIVKPFQTVILTAPTLTSAGGSQAWIQKNLPDYFSEKRYMIGPAKWVCASHTSLLIDDADHNVDEFARRGGWTILFPAPWNRERRKDPMEFLKHRMTILTSEE